jgi:hypothetical protein
VNAVDPAQPSLVTTISIPPEIRHMTKFGNRLILVGDDLLFVDATNPNNVQILGQFATPGYARGVAVSSDFIYVNDGAAGIMVLKFDE